LVSTDFRSGERIAQPLSIQIEKGGLSREKLENDLQRILKPLKNYDSILLACTHYPAIENEIKKHLKPSSQLLDLVDEMVGWVQQYGQLNKIQLKRYLCPQEVRNNWNCSVITAKKCLMFTFQKCILLCKMKWTLPSKLKLRGYEYILILRCS
jgi:glutamate racemase